MSGQDNISLGSIGLLGKYCPTSKKKFRHSLERVSRMHLKPSEDLALLHDCNRVQPFFAAIEQSSFEASIFASVVCCL